MKDVPKKLVELTDRAACRIRTLAERAGKQGWGLRIYIKRGGCAGYEYAMDFENQAREGDMIFVSRGIQVYVDLMSSFRLKGSVIDYEDTNLIGGGFKIENPNVIATCACGSSFRTEGSKKVESHHPPASSH